MTFVSFILFWPSTQTTFLFHIFRHLIIIFLIYLALVIDPCFFTVFLALTSILNYSRSCNKRSLAALQISFAFGIWISLPYHNSEKKIDFYKYYSLRSIIPFIPFILDHYLVSKVGFASRLTDLAFPILFSGFNLFSSNIDPLGIIIHPSIFCRDYPDFTYLPLRYGSPSFLIFFIGILVVLTSRWQSTKVIPQFFFTLIFKIIPFLIFIVYFSDYFYKKKSYLVSIQGISINNNLKCNDFINLLKNNSFVDILTINNNINNCSNFDLNIIKNYSSSKNLIIGNFNNVILIFGSKIYKNLNYFNESLGRFLILSNRNFYYEKEYFNYDADFLITLNGLIEDEIFGYPKMTSSLISQTTGTNRIHISNIGPSFYCDSNGHFQYIENNQSFYHSLKVTPNFFSYSKERRIIFLFITYISTLIVFIMLFFPIRILKRVSSSMSMINLK